MERDRRKHQRVPACYLSSFSTGQTTVGDAVVLDLSVGGCRVHSTTRVDPGTQVDLQIALPNHPAPIVLKQALVRWARRREFGVSFMSVRPEDQEPLRQVTSSARSVVAPLS